MKKESLFVSYTASISSILIINIISPQIINHYVSTYLFSTILHFGVFSGDKYKLALRFDNSIRILLCLIRLNYEKSFTLLLLKIILTDL